MGVDVYGPVAHVVLELGGSVAEDGGAELLA